MWDSDEVKNGQSVAVLYGGEALKPDKTYFWRVKTVTDTEGESEWSEIKAFRTADSLSEYATAYYPQVKTMESPITVKNLSTNACLVDFGTDAFAQLILTFTSVNESDFR